MEEWKEINGFEDYLISNYGNVYSKKNNKLLQHKSNGVYKNISLSKNNKPNYKYIHRLVCDAFCENPHNKPMVNHKDGNKLNNHYSNLEWVTKGENQSHAFRTGLRIPSEKQRQSVIRENKRRALLKRIVVIPASRFQ
jgi:hypothetical protein